MNIKQDFPELLKEMTIVTPTYSAPNSDGVILAPSVVETDILCSLQPNSATKSLAIAGVRSKTSRAYIDTEDLSIDLGFFLSSVDLGDFLLGEEPSDLVSINDFKKLSLYQLQFFELGWNYEQTGVNVSGSWTDGLVAGITARLIIWNPSLSPDSFGQTFISNFDFEKDMLLALTHPLSPVPPQGSLTRWNGTELVIVHRSEERHPLALGHILVLRRKI